ncbi:MAG TPA: primosomal protein N' [Clostridia bacterium]|nr:primosomal protein N' [Clostridia bacterium]
MKSVTAAVHISGKKFLILDYLVPDSLSRVQTGWGVICPLRGRSFSGVVLSVNDCQECLENSTLKMIEDVVTEGPIVPGDLIEIIFWIAENYFVSLNRAVELAFPSFARGKWIENISLTANRNDLHPLLSLKPEAGEIVDYMLDKGTFSTNILETRFGKDLADFCLQWISVRGLINRSRVFRPERRHGLRGNMVALTLEDPDIFMEQNKRAKKQVALVKALRLHGGKYPLNKLLRETGIKKEIVKILEKKGALRIYRSYPTWDAGAGVRELTEEQRSCLQVICRQIQRGKSRTFFLHGVTGSGKTEVYVRAAEFAVKQGRKVIVIVPEIALSSQLIGYFQRSFGSRAAVLHSRLASLERYQTWESIGRGEVDVVIGTRSAVFAPFSNLGLIIVDEEHDRSLKQDTTPCYHAREVADERCRLNDAVLVLGSATPSLETYFNVQKGSVRELEMPHRIGSRMPRISLVDMRRELRKGNTSILSSQMREAVKERLQKGEQVIAFLNRRGYAGFVSCRDCGFVFKCEHCDISLTYHAEYNTLKCHYCGFCSKVPSKCPHCGSRRIKAFGLGTEQVEAALQEAFPRAKILRLDSDSITRAGAHDRIIRSMAKGECDILIGTQMVSKGFDFSGVTLVCAIAADIDLNLPDFRAEERTFQMLVQVSGRAGRREKQGEVLIQTYSPERPGIAFLAKDRQEDFYAYELSRRKELHYPPFSRFVRLLFTSRNEGAALQAAERTGERLSAFDISYLGPAPAPIEKIQDSYRWHLIIREFKPEMKKSLNEILEEERSICSNRVNIKIDVDPLSMM